MPELPEVTVIVEGLIKKLKGLTLKSIEYDWPKKFFWGEFTSADLKGKKVTSMARRGKIVVIEFGNISVLIHLKLTGQLIYQDKKTRISGGHPLPPLNLPVPNKSTRATFSFTNGGNLYFNDTRKFGWVKIVKNTEADIAAAIGELGPDPLQASVDDFIMRIKGRKQGMIKQVLMDQKVISGVGNIYSDEGLWRAKIHPKRIVANLTEAELKTILKGLCEIMKLAIKKGGSSANSFVGSGGERGLYLSYSKAYHMTGKPCARCQTKIVREKVSGRSAHYCPVCQKLKT